MAMLSLSSAKKRGFAHFSAFIAAIPPISAQIANIYPFITQ
jgi:hypothetical protein